jgi:hypothetical protein
MPKHYLWKCILSNLLSTFYLSQTFAQYLRNTLLQWSKINNLYSPFQHFILICLQNIKPFCSFQTIIQIFRHIGLYISLIIR